MTGLASRRNPSSWYARWAALSKARRSYPAPLIIPTSPQRVATLASMFASLPLVSAMLLDSDWASSLSAAGSPLSSLDRSIPPGHLCQIGLFLQQPYQVLDCLDGGHGLSLFPILLFRSQPGRCQHYLLWGRWGLHTRRPGDHRNPGGRFIWLAPAYAAAEAGEALPEVLVLAGVLPVISAGQGGGFIMPGVR